MRRARTSPITLQRYFTAEPDQWPERPNAADEPELRQWTGAVTPIAEPQALYLAKFAPGRRDNRGKSKADPRSPVVAELPAVLEAIGWTWPEGRKRSFDNADAVADAEPKLHDDDDRWTQAAGYLWPDPPRPDRVQPRGHPQCVDCNSRDQMVDSTLCKSCTAHRDHRAKIAYEDPDLVALQQTIYVHKHQISGGVVPLDGIIEIEAPEATRSVEPVLC